MCCKLVINGGAKVGPVTLALRQIAIPRRPLNRVLPFGELFELSSGTYQELSLRHAEICQRLETAFSCLI